MTKAIVPTATPIMDIRERTVIKFRFFLLRKYLAAIKKERFKSCQLVFFFLVLILRFGDIQIGY